MKISNRRSIILATLATALLCTRAAAQLGAPNAPTSSASITFDDTNSLPPLGITNVSPATGPWNGTLFAPSLPTDPNGDFATGSITATGAGSIYSITPASIQLAQVTTTVGYAVLMFQFTVDYLVTGSPLPNLNPTYFPGFLVSGTVQPGGFASVSGTINYFDVSNAAYIGGLLDTVNYSYLNTTPGVFTNVPVFGLPSVGNTPLIPVGSSLTVTGSITFKVDPANISATPTPEPTAGLLTLLSLPLLLARRRALRA